MPFTLTTESVRRALRELLRGLEQCSQAEAQASRAFAERSAAADKTYNQFRAETQKQWDNEKAAMQTAAADRRQALVTELDAAAAAVERDFATAAAQITQLYERDEGASSKELQEAGWTLEAIFDAQKKQAIEKLHVSKRGFADQRSAAQVLRGRVTALLEEWNQIPKAVTGVAATAAPGEASAAVAERNAAAECQFARLRRLIAPRLLIGDRLLYAGFVAWLVLAPAIFAVAYWAVGKEWGPSLLAGLLGGSAIAAGGTFLAKWLLKAHAARGVQAACEPLHRALAEVETLCRQGEEQAEAAAKESVHAEQQKYTTAKRDAEKTHRDNVARVLARRNETGRLAVESRDHRRGETAARRTAELTKFDAELQQTAEAIIAGYTKTLTGLQEDAERQRVEAKAPFDAAVEAAAAAWNPVFEQINHALAAIAEENQRLFPDWRDAGWSDWRPPVAVPPSIRFGQFTTELSGRPTDSRLAVPPERVTLPALLPFPHRGSALLHAAGDGRGAAVLALQSMAVRFLTALPAGKVRLTIIDPVGLGENFAALMHLADHDPQLVGGRIWTESGQIEKRLADVTAHMENVIQKYLRSQYASIEEYNTQAGEVAEPYRVVVVANFPANFTAEAARRLERIAAGGASCGVYTLVSHDTTLPMPQDIDIAELSAACTNLRWQAGRFVWDDPDFAAYPLTMDPPPAGAELVRTLDKLGRAAKDANRVEVDFSFIAPPADKVWSADSRAGIDIPLGRAGATKRQHLRLGHGTAQHVLVAGKTGSGKSTLLHALVTNLALYYGPDEVELYLIDFKKGVEFKTYASHGLPHARVVAIESEREFGLSVLQRLDGELKRRGDLYRRAGVQDLKGYRESDSAARLPRILLVVDEFQEFFVEDDRVAQEAALLLDRLVRQGRAFGLHVLLGSQTLGGAYSLARSTIDQMAVRVALQCSEADAGLILSKDNNAARLLSRPGEAIYNDANGLIEGNDIFQVCWLDDDRREEYLRDVARRAADAGFRPPAPQIVFEGNLPSDLAANPGLRKLLDGPPPVKSPRDLVCPLGDAMAIKEPTAAVFRRQSANNLLLFGQQPDAARALAVASAVAAVVQQPADETSLRAVILDGTPADDPHAGYFERVFAGWPGVRLVTPRETAAAVGELTDEFDRRQTEAGPPVLLIAYGLHRLRDLRKADDDLGFGRRDGEPGPAARFLTLLRDGPTAGIHSFVWCDTLLNFQRAAERSTLREFEMKVLFQMGANDSSTLIDSPAASRLGVNRALFAHEELSAPEKFRPFSLPDEQWLVSVRDHFYAACGLAARR